MTRPLPAATMILVIVVVAASACATTTSDTTSTTPASTSTSLPAQTAITRAPRPPGSTDYRDYLINGILPMNMEVLADMVPPIYGYGDYSAYAYHEVPRNQSTAAQIRCMQDQGWPVEPIGTRGISFAPVPSHLNLAAQFDSARCYAGLRLPKYGHPPRSAIEDIYAYWTLVIAACLEDLGYQIPDPPSIDTFAETYPDIEWAPWRYVDWTPELADQCPPDIPDNWTAP
jgi:hypothetical protein